MTQEPMEMRSHRGLFSVLCSLLVLIVLSGTSAAIPAFSRQYGTSCSTCHIDFPKLNDFGKAFKDAGFKFPEDDESFIKIPPHSRPTVFSPSSITMSESPSATAANIERPSDDQDTRRAMKVARSPKSVI